MSLRDTVARAVRTLQSFVPALLIIASACSGNVVDRAGPIDEGRGSGGSGASTSSGGRGDLGAGGSAGQAGHGGGRPGASSGGRDAGVSDGGVATDGGSEDARLDASTEASREAGSHCDATPCGAHVLATGYLPGRLALRGDTVYFASFTDSVAVMSSVAKVPKTGGAVTLLSDSVIGIRALAADDQYVYFVGATVGADGGVHAALFGSPMSGGAPVRLVPDSTGANDIVVAAGRVYWGGLFDQGGIRWWSPSGIDGGSDHGVLSATAYAPFCAAADDAYLYFEANRPYSSLVRLALPNGTPEPVEGAPYGTICLAMAVGGGFLFCARSTSFTTTELARVPLSKPFVNVPPLAESASRIAADDQYVYWITQPASVIRRARLDLTEPETIVDAGPSAYIGDVAVDDRAIYWTTVEIADGGLTHGAVMSLAK